MPYTMNGIGTWYWGKKNVSTHVGTCEFCHKYVELISYDTTLYFVFFFIPLVPLGVKHVVDQCPGCNKHRVVNLAQWEQSKREDIEAARSAYRSNPQNPENAYQLIAATVSYHDKETFFEYAPEMQRTYSNDMRIHEMLGYAYSYFGRLDEAEQSLRRALSIEDTPERRELLGFNLLDQMRPQDARQYFQHILSTGIREKIAKILLLVEGFQAAGMHREALNLLNECRGIFPDITGAKRYKKLRSISEKNLSSKKKIKTRNIIQSRMKTASSGTLRYLLPRFIGPIVLLLILGGYLYGTWSMAQNRNVYLVNGLNIPYTVTINSQIHALRAFAVREITIPEGEVTIFSDNPSLQQQTCRIATPFFTRIFLERSFVINPDQVAIIVWQQVEYSTQQASKGGDMIRYHTGSLCYEFKGIDYFFESFPESITIEGKRAKRERITRIDNISPDYAIEFLGDKVKSEQARAFGKKILTYYPDDEQAISAFSEIVEPQEFLDYIRPRLDERPLKTSAHRVYQHFMEVSFPEHDLTMEYNEYYSKNPGNADVMYLLARVTPDYREAEQLYRKAISAPQPSVHAYAGLSYNKLASGEFEESLELINKACELRPDIERFRDTKDLVLSALKQYDAIIKEVRERRKKSPEETSRITNEFYFLLLDGQKEEALDISRRYVNQVSRKYNTATGERWRAHFDAILSYCEGSLDKYRERIAVLDSPRYSFQIAFLADNLKDAESAIAEIGEDEWALYLLLYLKAYSSGQPDPAETYLKQAIQYMEQGGFEERLIAGALEDRANVDHSQILHLSLSPDHKALILAVFGVLFPEHRNDYFSLANKLNFTITFPHYFLKSFIASQ